jgi:hypothetical protein
MRLNRLFIVCCSSLMLMGFAGCKKVVKIKVDQSLAPLSAVTHPGETLEWAASADGESFEVNFESGLCTQKSPIRASYGNPAVCTVARQNFGPEKRPILYTYSIEGNVPGAAIRSAPATPLPSPPPPGPPPPGTLYHVLVGPRGCPSC